MRFSVATFCDAATTRDGLLNVLGAGINLFNRDVWPAPLGASLAFMVEVPVEQFVQPFLFSVTLRSDTPNAEPIATIEGGFGGVFVNGQVPLQLAAVLPMDDVLLPGPGRYRCTIEVGSDLQTDLLFAALQTDIELWPLVPDAQPPAEA